MGKEALIFSNVQNEGTDMYVRHFEGSVRFGVVDKIGSVAFRSIGEREARHFFIEIESRENSESRTAFIQTNTTAEAVEAIQDDATLGWLVETASYEPTTPTDAAA